jgi:hypothetical protein
MKVNRICVVLFGVSGTRSREKCAHGLQLSSRTMSTISEPPERITKVTIHYPLFPTYF